MDTSETILYFGLVAVILILLLFLFIFYKGSSWVQKNFLREHNGRMEAEVLSMERERKRVAADLHDETGGIIYDLLRKAEEIEPKDIKSEMLLADLRLKIREMDESVQDIAEGLLPTNLKQYGLNAAITELARQRTGISGLDITLELKETEDMEEERLLHIYRAIQECVSNSIKHSKATRLHISTDSKYGNMVVTVTDNGIGFDAEKPEEQSKGLGLHTIFNRIRFLGGEVYLNSREGCEWLFFIPITIATIK